MAVNYETKAREARIAVLDMIYKAQTSHIASNFSIIDVATVLYENLKEKDIVVWSKGWAAATIYYFNAKYGRGPQEAITNFPEAPYLGLAETSVQGVEVNGGSVAHGLSVAVGMALGKKRAGEKGTVYCIMSDGELNEGSVWEAAMMAGHHKLNNLVAIIDKNGWQAMGRTDDILKLKIDSIFNAIKWHPRVCNGHNISEINNDLKRETKAEQYKDSPLVIIAKTIKGKGVSFFENHLLYHYKHVDEEDYKKAMKELTYENVS